MSGNEPKGEAVMNPIGTKLDTSDFDLSGDIAHGNINICSCVCFVPMYSMYIIHLFMSVCVFV